MKGLRFFQTIHFKLIIIYVLLILISMQLIGIFFVKSLEHYFMNNLSDLLNNKAYLLSVYVEPMMANNQNGVSKKSMADLNDVVNNLFANSRDDIEEIQVIDANGIVLTTSRPDHQSIIGKKNTQTLVSRALQNITDERTLRDPQDGKIKEVIARPVSGEGKVMGAVYIVASMDQTFGMINRINRIFITGTMIALGLTALLGIILSRTITKPIQAITKQADAIAEGNFNRQLKVMGRDEIGQLSMAINYMTNRLKEALSLNEEEKEKFASILLNMNDGVIATDDLGRVIVINRRAQQMLHVDEEDVLEKDIGEVLDIPKEDIGKHVLGEERSMQIEYDGSDRQHELSLRISFSLIHRRGRGVTGTIAVLQDVTEQERLEQSRKEFVANVSHELRTPLTTIKSYLEALDDGTLEDTELAQHFVGVTRSETERMIRLVSDLLQLSRLDSKQATMHKEETNIEEMLDEVADRFSFQLQQKYIEMHLETEEQLPEVSMDRDQIDQVLDNLVSNAIKYTPEGGSIYLRAVEKEPQVLEIAVEDTGMGIPNKDLERIFERFYRVDKARSRSMGGTGLGLSIAREIIKAHGGQISLQSEYNQGTTVTFSLPVETREAERT